MWATENTRKGLFDAMQRSDVRLTKIERQLGPEAKSSSGEEKFTELISLVKLGNQKIKVTECDQKEQQGFEDAYLGLCEIFRAAGLTVSVPGGADIDIKMDNVIKLVKIGAASGISIEAVEAFDYIKKLVNKYVKGR